MGRVAGNNRRVAGVQHPGGGCPRIEPEAALAVTPVRTVTGIAVLRQDGTDVPRVVDVREDWPGTRQQAAQRDQQDALRMIIASTGWGTAAA